MRLFFDDESFDAQRQRSVGTADSGMAQCRQCLAISAQIEPDDRDSWYQAWSGVAGRLVAQVAAPASSPTGWTTPTPTGL